MTTPVTTIVLAAFLMLFAVGRIHAGSIVGEVKFTDPPPKLPVVKVSKDQDYCGESLPNGTYLID